MLALVNDDRKRAGLAPVELDPIASRAAQRHAEDMLKHGFTAHWGSDGSVPEQRYTEAGGEHLAHENATCFFDGVERELEPNPVFSADALERVEAAYMAEVAPNDGHKQNVLKPTHTLLGVGVAKSPGIQELCVAQEFVDAYGTYDALPQTARPGQRIVVSGRVEEPATFGGIGIAVGPLPTELSARHLNGTSTYMMPVPYATYFPPGFVSPRPVKVDGSRFSIELALDRGRGRYAVSVWARFPDSGKELTMVSLRTILVR